MTYGDILDFWFQEIPRKAWWRKDAEFDRLVRRRFLAVHEAAKAGELHSWRTSGNGRLAEIIVLDQFSRNIHRDSPAAFACDAQALTLAQEAVGRRLHEDLETVRKPFLLMPYMHSESALIHEEAARLFAEPGLEGSLDFELRHKEIIDRFGRYPHRNAILGRESTPEEAEFLKQPGSSF